YSAFSFRSPCSRASAIAFDTRGRSSVFRRCSSSRSAAAPSVVIGKRCMLAPSRPAGVQVLQTAHLDVIVACSNCLTYSLGRSNGCRVVHLALQRRATDRRRVTDRLLAFSGVDDQVDLTVLDHVDNVRTP